MAKRKAVGFLQDAMDLSERWACRFAGLVQNPKRTYRLYRAEGFHVQTKKRRKLPRRDRVVIAMPDRPMQRWSLDFVNDQLADYRRCRILNIVDDQSKFCPGQIVEVSIPGTRLARLLDELGQRHGLPEEIVLDNGPERPSRAMFEGRNGLASSCASSNPASPSRTPSPSRSMVGSGTGA